MTEQEIFLAVLELPDPAARSTYLTNACGSDQALRSRVVALLRSHEEAGSFLDRPAVEAADFHTSATCENIRAAASATQSPPANQLLTFLAPPSRPDSLGRLGHYEVLEVLGRGGFGIVFRAFDEKLQRVVAVKALAPQLAAGSPARKRFLREARSSAKVRHENVVQVYAVEELPLPFLVMEYVPGETLQQRLDRTGPLEPVDTVAIGRQIAQGLAAAHATGLIHRDIKPGNILIEAGPQPRVKITDFGLARAADDASMTQSGIVAGTPMFMSPEQANGEPIDCRADLFSLGSVLYTMCSGRPPFRAANTFAVLKRVADDTPRPIPEIIPEVPHWLCDIISRLHAKKPEDRFGSATEVAEMLARGPDKLDQCTHEANQRTSSFTLNKLLRHRRQWLGAVVVLLLAVIGLGGSEATGVTNVRGTLIHLFSPSGTLIVEVDDPAVSVAIDGEEIVITGAGAKEIRLKPGPHQLVATKDGKPVRDELVRVERNGQRVVRISREQPAPGTSLGVPAAAEWEKLVAELPADKQVVAVLARLQRLNARFDGRAKPTIMNDRVTGLEFCTDNVSDISPVRALRDLRSLSCQGSENHYGSLVDLSPLEGMKLRQLDLTRNPVADLSPLHGMPLTSLAIRVTAVADLTPLQGMPLTQLRFGCTQVADLSPLKGMQLTELVMDHLPVSELSPLRGMPLRIFHCGGSGRIRDLTPLKAAPLHFLNCADTQVTDLSPIQKMPLTQICLTLRSEHEAAILRSIKTLEIINYKPADKFWAELRQECD